MTDRIFELEALDTSERRFDDDPWPWVERPIRTPLRRVIVSGRFQITGRDVKWALDQVLFEIRELPQPYRREVIEHLRRLFNWARRARLGYEMLIHDSHDIRWKMTCLAPRWPHQIVMKRKGSRHGT